MDHYHKFIIIMFVLAGNYWTTAVGVERDESPSMLSEEEMVEIAGYGQQKLSTVLITGTLLCGHHRFPVSVLRENLHHNLSLSPGTAGASVAVSCHPGRKTGESNWVKSTTDEYGDFVIDLPSHLHGIPNLEKICLVRVVQLPISSPCNSAFRGKNKGMTLSSVGEGIRTYTTEAIHIRPKTPHTFRHRRGSRTELVKAS